MELIREELIQTQQEYIKFLGDNINSNATFLNVNGLFTSVEDVEKGIEFRKKINFLTQKLNPPTYDKN